MDAELWEIVRLTLGVALESTLVIFVPGLLVAWALSRRGWRGRAAVEALVTVPLVVPPTAVGLGLLLALGWLRDAVGLEIAFTRSAVVLACAIVSFPLLVRQARTALEEVDTRLLGVARTLGRGPLSCFVEVHAPLAWRGLLAGVVLAFARALGEFGATILVAGNIPGRTQTLALAIFQRVQVGRQVEALLLAGVATAIAFVALWGAESLARGRERTLSR